MPNIKALATLVRKAAPKIKEAVETAKDIVADVKTKGAVYKKTGFNTTEIRKRLEQRVTIPAELEDTKQFIWQRRQINPSQSIGRTIEDSPKHSRLRNVAAGFYKKNRKLISRQNRDDLRHFRDEVDTDARRIRQPAYIREAQTEIEQSIIEGDDTLNFLDQRPFPDVGPGPGVRRRTGSRSVSENTISDAEHRRILEESMSPGMRQLVEGVAQRAERRGSRLASPGRTRWNPNPPSYAEAVNARDQEMFRQHRIDLERQPLDVENLGEPTNQGFEQYILKKYGRRPTRLPDEN